MKPQTIQIFLPDGSPISIREAEITNRLVKAVLFPRARMQEVAARELVNYTGVYFLFGTDAKVYIGEGENCFERIKEHNRVKDFWTHCVIFTTKTNEYTKTDGKYLEHYCLQKASEADRYKTENSTGSRKPSISESREHDLLDNFETLKILISSLGFPVFDSLLSSQNTNQDIFQIKFQGICATGEYNSDGFVIHKGSEARLEVAKSFRENQRLFRENLIEQGILEEKSGKLVFTENYAFSSPSSASDMIKGNSSNGWIEWKNKEGKTLDDLKRK
jgi:hypothetical protein